MKQIRLCVCVCVCVYMSVISIGVKMGRTNSKSKYNQSKVIKNKIFRKMIKLASKVIIKA